MIEITDDLTGAADSGSFFTSRGEKLNICTSQSAYKPAKNGEIVSVNLSSRNVKGEEAYKRHLEMCSVLKDEGNSVIMKKIGTGFRGNDQYELAGMLDALPEYSVFIIDNAPDLGTFTLYGNQYCEGQLLHKSIYANDPVMPPKESYIPSILSKGIDKPIGLVDIDTVKSGAVQAATARLLDEGKRIIVFDAITRDDTNHIIRELMPLYPKIFWTGSLGIADGLGEVLFGPTEKKVLPARKLRCVCFSASAYGIVKKQIAYSKCRGLNVVEVDIDSYIDGNNRVPYIAAEAAAAVTQGENLMLCPKVEKYSYKPGTSEKIMNCFSLLAPQVCKNVRMDRLVMIGGETAQTILRQLNVDNMELHHPIEPGTAQGILADGMLAGKEFALKGGSMGSALTLENMMCRREVYS